MENFLIILDVRVKLKNYSLFRVVIFLSLKMFENCVSQLQIDVVGLTNNLIVFEENSHVT